MTKRVAIIGGGCAGLSCAWHLSQNTGGAYEVHVFEKSNTLGGHAHTLNVTLKNGEKIPVDVGFMVFNDANYPNMTAWFEALGVESEISDMSLSVSLDRGQTVEWSSTGLSGIFANKWQMFQPGFYSFLKEMVRFNREAANILLLPKDDPNRIVTTAQYLRQNGYSDKFCSFYLLPMMAALWSASIEDVLEFPAEQLIGFMCNHRMLQIFDRPLWKTVKDRSQSYTSKMTEYLGDRAHLNCNVSKVQKVIVNGSVKYEVLTSDSTLVGSFDEVVFACHPPQAADMLSKNIGDEFQELFQALKDITYADNSIYVHSDPSLMPQVCLFNIRHHLVLLVL